MRNSLALLLVLVFLTASSLMVAKPAFSSPSGVAENTWTQKAPIQEARHGLGAAVVDGRIYAIGGFTQKNGIVGTNEEYDPKTDTWSYKAPMPTPRYYFAIAVYQNKIYCIGGCVGETKEHGQTLTGVNEVYDPATNTWENKTAVPTAKIWATASVVKGKIYVIGGYPNTTLNEVYDPETDAWTTKAPMPPEHYGVQLVYSDKIYVIGGYYVAPNIEAKISAHYVSSTQIYDPVTDTWSLGTSPPTAFNTGSAGVTTGFMAPKRIYVFSGGSNQIYDPESDDWTSGADMPTSREDFAVAVVNDLIYVIGGWATTYVPPLLEMRPFGSGVVTTNYATVEAYTPFGYGTPDPSYDGVAPEIAVVFPENKTYYTANVTLDFAANEPVFSVHYKLDGEIAVEISGNTTLAGLAVGVHNLTVSAFDAAGNMGASETVFFAVAEPEPFPVAPVAAASGVAVAVIGVSLLFYFKKRKH